MYLKNYSDFPQNNSFNYLNNKALRKGILFSNLIKSFCRLHLVYLKKYFNWMK